MHATILRPYPRRPAAREAMLAFLLAMPAAWVLGELAVLLGS